MFNYFPIMYACAVIRRNELDRKKQEDDAKEEILNYWNEYASGGSCWIDGEYSEIKEAKLITEVKPND